MPLGTEVGFGLRDIVFDVDPATAAGKNPTRISYSKPLASNPENCSLCTPSEAQWPVGNEVSPTHWVRRQTHSAAIGG